MTPSLLSLFKRGQYRRLRLQFAETQAQDGGAIKERHERERFLTASIGFVARHDPLGFGHHLLSVFRKAGAPVLPGEAGFEVKIEHRMKRKWLDLVVEERYAGGTVVHVVEAKLGAGLAAHQDPSAKEFWKKDQGYGSLICRGFPNAIAIRYWVLGHDKPIPAARSKKQHRDWKAAQLLWSDLADRFPRSPLAEDLHRLLATVGITPFMMKETESIKLSGDACDVSVAANAYRVLEDTCAVFGLQQKHRQLEVQSAFAGTLWHFGIDLRAIRSGGNRIGNQRLLTQAVEPKDGDSVAWLGYEQDGNGSDLSIWFYCGNAEKRRKIERKLKHYLKASLELHKRSDGHFVCATKPKSCDAADRKWLAEVFKAVGMNAASI